MSIATKDFLLEIGTEELPAKLLLPLSETLKQQIQNGLNKASLEHGEVSVYATPRRMAILVNQLNLQQPDKMVERRGPAVNAAFDAEGKPTPALVGFAQSCGSTVAELQKIETDKGTWFYFKQMQVGETAEKLLPNIVRQAIAQLPIPKPMRWGSEDTLFVRPVKWVVMMLGSSTIETEILGKQTSNITYGHRFHHPEAIKLTDAKNYADELKNKGMVIADFKQRKEMILNQLKTIAGKNQVAMDNDLLNEVTGLVEWPVALLGEFEPSFLDLPPEVIITVMKVHQRYFPVLDATGNLQPYFVTISNIQSSDAARVIAGNQRVIRARLSDAEFFYHSDKQHKLSSYSEKLQKVIFQQKLGTLFDKATRITDLAEYLAKALSQSTELAKQSASLCKNDLMSAMVSEFPELQGIMGYYYAMQDGLSDTVALAIKEHYQPRFAKDELPSSMIGAIVAIADKIDTIVGLFGIKQPPTGEKDPFALRRAALGILRIMIEKQMSLDLKELIQQSIKSYQIKFDQTEVLNQTFAFMIERLRAWYLDRGIMSEVFAAVEAITPTQPLDFHQRIQAVQHFMTLTEAKSLTAAQKRVSNILKKSDGGTAHHPINPSLLQEPAEKQLAQALEQKNKELEQLYQSKQYTEALNTLASLQSTIDNFFDHVMVNVDDPKLRENRLSLLHSLRRLFTQIADISLLPN